MTDGLGMSIDPVKEIDLPRIVPKLSLLLPGFLEILLVRIDEQAASATTRHRHASDCKVHGEIDLRGFLGIDPAVAQGYEDLSYTVHIKGDGTKEQFAEVHNAVMATSPNFYNLSRAVVLKPALVID
jgi:hypothetical protein